MINYRYDMQIAYDKGVREHPQVHMGKLGYKVIKSEPVAVGNCWWFRVEDRRRGFTPSYLSKLPENFKFSDEGRRIGCVMLNEVNELWVSEDKLTDSLRKSFAEEGFEIAEVRRCITDGIELICFRKR